MKSLPDSAQTAQTILESPCRFALSEVAYYSNLVCQKVNIDSTIDLGPRRGVDVVRYLVQILSALQKIKIKISISFLLFGFVLLSRESFRSKKNGS